MSLGSDLAREALALVGAFGYPLTFRRATGGTYDAATGTVTGASNSDESVTGLFIAYKNTEVDGSNIQRGDRKALLPASGLVKVPQINDQLLGEGDTVSVVSVQEINANGVPIVYVCQVRE